MSDEADRKAGADHQALIVALICIAGLMVRLWNLGAESLWQDEGFSVYLSRHSLTFIMQSMAYEFHPPLYYVLLHLWLMFSTTDAWIRLLSVIPAVLTIPCIYALGKDLHSRNAGIVAAFLLALSPLHGEFSREARPYSLFCFLFSLSMLLFIRARASHKDRLVIFYCLATIAAIWTQFTGLFLLLIQALILMARKEKMTKRRAACLGFIIVLTLPVIHSFVLRLLDLRTKLFWIPAQTPMQDAAQIMDAFVAWSGRGFFLVALLALPLALWLIPKSFSQLKQVALLWLLVPITIFIATSFWRPLFLVRQLLFCLPPFLLIVGSGIALLFELDRKIAAGILLAAMVIPGLLGLSALHGEGHKENWRDLAAAVKQKGMTHDGILFVSEYPSYTFYRYYDDRRSAMLLYRSLDHKGDEETLTHSLEGITRIWVVAHLEGRPDYPIIHAIDWLRAHWVEKSHERFRGQDLFLFERKGDSDSP
jgi:mannosyltransferase